MPDDGITRETAPVVAVDVAPDEPPNKMRWLREKPVPQTILRSLSIVGT